jgi:hypothetical protein
VVLIVLSASNSKKCKHDRLSIEIELFYLYFKGVIMAIVIVKVRLQDNRNSESSIIKYKDSEGREWEKSSLVNAVDRGNEARSKTASGPRLQVKKSSNGIPFLSSEPDSTSSNNLLSLPRF